ncbi:MAG TPA: ABC transporter permease [Clostridiaceae bacterium]
MRTITMTKRVIKQIIGDKRTLALLLFAPIFVLFLFSTILNSPIVKPNLEAVNLPPALIDSIKSEAKVIVTTDTKDALSRLKNRKFDGLLTFENNTLTVTVEGSDSSINGAVKKAISVAFSEYTKSTIFTNPKLSQAGIKMLENKFVFINGAETMTAFDSVAPMMMGFFIFFFVFLLAGISFLRERISGTLDRLLATPIKRYEIVLGYFLGFGIFVMLQTIIIQLFMTYVLGITIKGSPLLVLLINIILAAGSLSLGTLLSAFAKNEFQLIQFIPIVIVPQILFSGLFSLREAPLWVNVLSKFFPLTYGADALKEVALRGSTFSDIGVDLLALTGYALLFILLNSLALKKYRRL